MHQNPAIDVHLQDFTGDREQRDRSVVLCIGLVLSFWNWYHRGCSLGNLPVVIERFNNLVSTEAILTAVDFNILADILSGPFALLISSAHNNSKTSSSVQRSSGGLVLRGPCRLQLYTHGNLGWVSAL